MLIDRMHVHGSKDFQKPGSIRIAISWEKGVLFYHFDQVVSF